MYTKYLSGNHKKMTLRGLGLNWEDKWRFVNTVMSPQVRIK